MMDVSLSSFLLPLPASSVVRASASSGGRAEVRGRDFCSIHRRDGRCSAAQRSTHLRLFVRANGSAPHPDPLPELRCSLNRVTGGEREKDARRSHE